MQSLREMTMLSSVRAALAALPLGLAERLGGKVILATGCSGFFGLWTLACLCALREKGVDVNIKIASKNPGRFNESHPYWAQHGHVEWIKSTPSEWLDRVVGPFDYGLHMAASSDAATNAADPVGMIESMVSGAGAMARLCAKQHAPLLMVSSGAVYGRRLESQGLAKESDDAMAPPCLDARQAYGQAKRASETAVASQAGLEWTVARPFAFLGPYLPLATHFAAGNFMRDAAAGKPIEIKGDGSPLRSFMHPADLAAWQLWLMCCGPRGEAVNVGSGQPISLGALAGEIASMVGAPAPVILGSPSGATECYAPDVSKARALGLTMAWERKESIAQCMVWLAMEGGSWQDQRSQQKSKEGVGQ
jgi:nucleoside-diphosphate-sugar epimerase